jgi:hypothetical protein
MFLIVFFLLFVSTVLSQIPNYSIALNKYAQGMSFSNKEKEYLDKVGIIIAKAVKHAAAKQSEEKDAETVSDDSSIMDPETFNELDFISKKGEGIFYPKDMKLSRAAQAFLVYLSTAQTNDVQVLEKRRSIIMYLQKNPELKTELLRIIGSLEKETEQSFLDLSKELTEKEKNERNEIFLSRSFSNAAGIIKFIDKICFKSNSPILFGVGLGLLLIKNLVPEKVSTGVYNQYAKLCSKHPHFFTVSLTVPSVAMFALSKYFNDLPARFFVDKLKVFLEIFSIRYSPLMYSRLSTALNLSIIVVPSLFYARSNYKKFSDNEQGLIFAQKVFGAGLDNL